MRLIARKIEISLFVHATENREKVLKAVQNIFPQGIGIPRYTETNLDGYYGDPITKLSFLIKNRKSANILFYYLIHNLSNIDFIVLLDELPRRIDDTKNLYLRFDKQKAFLSKIALYQHDSIRVKISIIVPHKTDTIELLRHYLEEIRN